MGSHLDQGVGVATLEGASVAGTGAPGEGKTAVLRVAAATGSK
jgi:hypothetical protein